jgi:hypothetical protein
MRKILLGQDRDITCVWKACDPYSTREEISVHWRRTQVEQALLQSWAHERNTTMASALEGLRGETGTQQTRG